MSVSRPLLLGLGGLALLGVVQWVILPAFEYRADNASRAERARQRHLSMQLLTDDYARLSQSNAAAPAKNRSLFSLVNKEADRLSLSRRIEALRPAARKENDGSERIEMRLTGLYLNRGCNGCTRWNRTPASASKTSRSGARPRISWIWT